MDSSNINMSLELGAALVVTIGSAGLAITFRHELKQSLQGVVGKIRAFIVGAPNPPPRPSRPCPNNPAHSLDPTWEVCPYCEAEQRSQQKSERIEVVAPSRRERTVVGEVPLPRERRETKAMPPGAVPESGGRLSEGDTRRIVGV